MPKALSLSAHQALSEGRAVLKRGESLAARCSEIAKRFQPALRSGYVIAQRVPQKGANPRPPLRFSAPEPLSAELRSCLLRATWALRFKTPPLAGMEQSALYVLFPPVPPSISDGDPALDSSQPAKRSFEEIEEEVKRHLPALGACFEELWERRPHAGGTVVLGLSIHEGGTIAEATIARREERLKAAEPCLLEVAKRLHFPRRAQRTTMTYPLLVTPESPPPS